MKGRRYELDPATLRMVPARPTWRERLLNGLTMAVKSMVKIWKFIN